VIRVTDDGGSEIEVALAGITWDGRELVGLSLRLPAQRVTP